VTARCEDREEKNFRIWDAIPSNSTYDPPFRNFPLGVSAILQLLLLLRLRFHSTDRSSNVVGSKQRLRC
jgi:hypothetical protein